MKKKVLALGAILTILSLESYADSNNCENFNVLITNNTNQTCRLLNHSLNAGYYKYTSSVPVFIPANTTTYPITLTQGIMGPELILSYDCGEHRTITLRSKQTLCFFHAGDVQGQVLAAHHLNADYIGHTGSFFWSQHGSLQWRIFG
ncbi:hypothetical protein [Legionella impletisoli]|uniref:Uncharacterized protein n=1 Tax=Legionella impletisoli TaxID=343510 RepID=A0A917JNA7_9GAMM|nr:hypothetical protein [Legionella impletisoli]GGI75236.1 hypothetical protein GCM10007966_00050 [Legionella impletisoli]